MALVNFFQQNKKLREKIDKLIYAQEMLGIKFSELQDEHELSRYRGNQYRSYSTAVTAIEKKYNGTADWGVILTGNIIDLRASFIIANGLVVRAIGKKEDAKNELEWTENFLAYNKLDRELIQELAKEAEIEGKIALKLKVEDVEGWRNYDKMVSVRFISWSDKKYEIKTAENDYLNYEKLKWKPTGKSGGETLEANEFVYNKFGGRIMDPNDAQPKIMKCLTQIDDIDKALRDWREINHYFASPIPDVECEDKNAAKDAKEYLKEINWKIKKGFVHAKSKFQIIGPDMAGVESLKDEAIEKMKIVSGTTGVPIHFLGLLDLLKNRATGENTREMVSAGTSKERMVWIGTYAEVIEKAMNLYNEEVNKKKSGQLDPDKVRIDIPIYTEEQWLHIEKVLIPMFLGGAISLEYLLSQIPAMDVEEEMTRQEEKEESEAESLKAQVESLKDELAMAKTNVGNEEEV